LRYLPLFSAYPRLVLAWTRVYVRASIVVTANLVSANGRASSAMVAATIALPLRAEHFPPRGFCS
jgi:hypothetical protein